VLSAVFLVLLAISNLGFAGGNNKGINVANGELILLINNDTWVETNFVEELYKYYTTTSSDVVGPKELTYNAENKLHKSFPYLDILGHPIRLQIKNDRFFYLSGVCILFSKKLYIESKGLDENFFMYMEEIDWFWRLQLLSKKKITYSENIYVYHAGAGSTGTGIKYSSFLWRNQNTLQMLLKNYAWYNLVWVLPLYILQNIFEIIAFTLVGKPKIAYTYILGWLFNIKHLPRILKKRREVQSVRLVGDREILKLMYKGPGKLHHLMQYFK
jgi:GT2 family glycosyltransferase